MFLDAQSPPACPRLQDTVSVCLSVCLSLTHAHTPFDKMGNDVKHDYMDKSIPSDSPILTLTHSSLNFAARCSHLGIFKNSPDAQVIPSAG